MTSLWLWHCNSRSFSIGKKWDLLDNYFDFLQESQVLTSSIRYWKFCRSESDEVKEVLFNFAHPFYSVGHEEWRFSHGSSTSGVNNAQHLRELFYLCPFKGIKLLLWGILDGFVDGFDLIIYLMVVNLEKCFLIPSFLHRSLYFFNRFLLEELGSIYFNYLGQGFGFYSFGKVINGDKCITWSTSSFWKGSMRSIPY